MPLPNLNRQCTARVRSTGNQCLNPAAFGCKTCRYHGARRKETVKAGKHHPQFKTGERSKEAIEQFRSKMLELHNIEALARSAGVITGPKTKGRKPKEKKNVNVLR